MHQRSPNNPLILATSSSATTYTGNCVLVLIGQYGQHDWYSVCWTHLTRVSYRNDTMFCNQFQIAKTPSSKRNIQTEKISETGF